MDILIFQDFSSNQFIEGTLFTSCGIGAMLADHQAFGYQPIINFISVIIEAFRYILGDSPFVRSLAII